MFAFPDPNSGVTGYFLKDSSRVLLLFQVKAMHPCTADDNIANRDLLDLGLY